MHDARMEKAKEQRQGPVETTQQSTPPVPCFLHCSSVPGAWPGIRRYFTLFQGGQQGGAPWGSLHGPDTLPESPRRQSEAQSGGFLTVRELPAYQAGRWASLVLEEKKKSNSNRHTTPTCIDSLTRALLSSPHSVSARGGATKVYRLQILGIAWKGFHVAAFGRCPTSQTSSIRRRRRRRHHRR
ncbi:hypothetical protein GQ607_001947 [Colletotrichum asianum]|uniref:Uncharacterized protein n=1 Tax=Colletotrichum asianum TaxID=702518 RepID=A0A8H3WS62_9PEZI|nr:hypothetical protein GQ607_001947 [Colletotrichum asianum]